ncbi:MAG: hypothetical protein V4473_00070 [Patescibacteria group bacterium]
MKSPGMRTLLFVTTLICVLVLPWWVSALLLCALTIYFPLYLEVLLFGFLFDTLYASKYAFPYTGLLSATVLLLIVLFFRTKIRT